MSAAGVHHLVRADLPRATETLAAAFADDPLMTWICPDAAARPRTLQTFMSLCLGFGLRRGHTYGTGTGDAVAVWAPPDVPMMDDDELGGFVAAIGAEIGDRTDLVFEGLGGLAEVHPHDVPHFYLMLLGTAPGAQNRGLGGALLDHVTSRCDAEGLPAYLESSNGRNVPMYERHGFRVVHEITLPDGPVIRPMWRDPAPR